MGDVLLWMQGDPGRVDPVDLEWLSTLHPLWREEIAQRKPWRLRSLPVLGNVLRAEGHENGDRILLVGRCSSVMDVAAALWAKSVLQPLDAVVAGCQWAGRGQLGRRWISPPGNLFAAWLVPQPPQDFCALSLLMGYAVWLALQPFGVDAEIKWPNDVLIGNRKVAGILCEQRGPVILVGVGVNIASHPSAADLREDSATGATSLLAAGLSIGPLRLWERIWHHANALLDPGRHAGLAKEIEPHLAFRGATVRITSSGETAVITRLCGLDRSGALWVDQAGERRRITSGTIEVIAPQEIVSR